MNKKKGLLIGIIAIVIIAGILFITMQKKGEKKETEIKRVPVDTVKKQDITIIFGVDGSVELKDKKEIFANNTGTIEKVYVKEGDKVQKGDTIASYTADTIDSLNIELREANLSLKSAELTLDELLRPESDKDKKQKEKNIKAKAKEIEKQTENIADLEKSLVKKDEDIQKAKKEKEAGDVLYKEGAIAQVEYQKYEEVIKNEIDAKEKIQQSIIDANENLVSLNEEYQDMKNEEDKKNEEEANKNKIESQKLAIEQAKMRKDKITEKINKFEPKIISPITGTILKLDISEDENMTDGKLIAEISDLNNLYIKSKVSQEQAENIEVGQKATLTGGTYDGETGTVTKVSDIAEANQVPIEISLPSDTNLKAGFNVSLDITTKTLKDTIVIPVMAYLIDNGEYSVFAVDKDNVVTKKEIVLGEYDKDVVSVEGLEEGELIVTQPVEGLTEGMTIIPILPEGMPEGKGEL